MRGTPYGDSGCVPKCYPHHPRALWNSWDTTSLSGNRIQIAKKIMHGKKIIYEKEIMHEKQFNHENPIILAKQIMPKNCGMKIFVTPITIIYARSQSYNGT